MERFYYFLTNLRASTDLSTLTVWPVSHGDVFGEWEGAAVVTPFECNYAPAHAHEGSKVINGAS